MSQHSDLHSGQGETSTAAMGVSTCYAIESRTRYKTPFKYEAMSNLRFYYNSIIMAAHTTLTNTTNTTNIGEVVSTQYSVLRRGEYYKFQILPIIQ